MNKAKRYDVVIVSLSIYFLISYSQIYNENLRYLKYLLPFLSFFTYTISSSKNVKNIYSNIYVSKFIKFYLVLYSIFFLIQFFNQTMSFRFFANVYFVLSPLFFVYYLAPFININKINYYFKFLAIATILGYILEQNTDIIATIKNFRSLLSAIGDSSIKSESHVYSFIFAFLLLFSYLYIKSNKTKAILTICMLLAFKRVVIGGILISIITYFFINFFGFGKIAKHKKIFSVIFSILSLITITLYYKIANGDYDDVITKNLGMSVNFILMGRQELYAVAINKSKNFSPLIGIGVGVVDNIITSAYAVQNNSIKNLHSELLRAYLETGVFFYFLWIYLFVNNSIRTPYTFLAFILLYIILLTDNVFIYFDTMFVFYFLASLSILSSRLKVHLKAPKVNVLTIN